MIPRTGEIDAFADAIVGRDTVRIDLKVLWVLWAAAAPRLVGDPSQVEGLGDALNVLADRGTVALPARAWDRSTVPPLPRSITVPSARRSASTRPWLSFPWCADLGWVASLPSLSSQRFADLVAVNDWLARTGGDVATVPVRYRSVEIFGAEKHLDYMATTDLFGPGRLSLNLLCCVRLPSPLPAVPVGPGPDALIVENSDTYWVAVEAARIARGPVGVVGFGSGNSFPSQIEPLGVDLGGRGPATGTIWYWGDLDPAGVAIARKAATAIASVSGVGPLRPPYRLWAAMAEQPTQDTGRVDWDGVEPATWFGSNLWNLFAAVISDHGRVAQESVTRSVVLDWMRRPI